MFEKAENCRIGLVCWVGEGWIGRVAVLVKKNKTV